LEHNNSTNYKTLSRPVGHLEARPRMKGSFALFGVDFLLNIMLNKL
jgi:hypothetical protein